MSLPFDAVNREALAQAKVLLPNWLPGGRWAGVEWVTLNPSRNDSKPGSFSINSETGVWKDFASDDGGGDLVDLFAWLHGISNAEACKDLAQEFSIMVEGRAAAKPAPPALRYPCPILPVPMDAPPLAPQPAEEGRWEYKDQAGRLLMVRVRTPDRAKGKVVKTWTWCEVGPGRRDWREKAPEKPWPLYGLDRLARQPGAMVLVVEGEKTADAAELAFLGVVAVTSGSASSVASADWQTLAGQQVVIWPDADEPGQGYAVQAARRLAGVAASVAMVPLPESITEWVKPGKDKPGGWDLADAPPAGVDLIEVLNGARLVTHAHEDTRPFIHPTLPKLAAWIVGDVGRMLTEDPPPIRWLVEGLIPAGVPGILAARASAGKSTVALNVAMGLASGLSVLGRPVATQEARGVIFAGLEDDEEEFHRRVRRGMALLEEDPDWTPQSREALTRRLVPLFPNRISGEKFSLEAQWQTLAEKANAIPGGCGLIILDTLARMVDGEENSASELRPFIEAVSALAQATGAAVLCIHHVGKGNDTPSDKKLWQRLHPEALRGSSAIEAGARFVIQMAALSASEAQTAGLDAEQAMKGVYVALSLSKVSAAEKGSTVLLVRRPGDEACAGCLILHPDSERALAVINGSAGVLKLNKRDSVLLAIAESGGLAKLDQRAAAAIIWPDSSNPKGQWDKALSAIRKEKWICDLSLTDAGWAKAETVGFIPSTRKAVCSPNHTGSSKTLDLPPGSLEMEETERGGEVTPKNPSFHSSPLGNRNGRKDSGVEDLTPLYGVSGDGFTVDL